jgi:hypothetical protein
MVSPADATAGNGGEGFDPMESLKKAISQRKRRANRRNGRKSRGPKTEEGKKRSSRNAIKHGVFCQDVLLPEEDEVKFSCMHNALISDLSPQNVFELSLVGQIMAAVAHAPLPACRDGGHRDARHEDAGLRPPALRQAAGAHGL